MKKIIKSLTSVILVLALALCFVACNKSTACGETNNGGDVTADEGLWAGATYKENKEFGSGSKTAVVEVKIEDKTVTFTIKTDKDTVGAALLEHSLIAGEESAYGLYVKVVNGVTADFDIDQSYWGFYINGEMAMTGVDSTEITEGTVYRLEYTK